MRAVEHYREGERLLDLAVEGGTSPVESATLISLAHGHFAAAQIGATLMTAVDLDYNDPDVRNLCAAVIEGLATS